MTPYGDVIELSLRSPWVRALAFSCFSPPIISAPAQSNWPAIPAPTFPLDEERQHWLRELDADDGPLRDYLQRHCSSRRLGLRYEALWHFFLNTDRRTDLLGHNIPVRNEHGRSLGEFDVVYRDRDSGEVYHLELAVKFFLGLPSPQGSTPLSRWLGPNSADRLDRKLDRLLSHQFPLAHCSEGQAALTALGVTTFSAQLQLGGILFHQHNPLHAAQPDQGLLHPSHPRGYWLRIGNFATTDDWRLLEKPDWLGASYDNATPLPRQLEATVNRRPLMLINSQQERVFLVSDHWPASTSSANTSG